VPRFAESIPAILEALADREPPGSSKPASIAEVGTFAGLVAAFLARAGDARAVAAAIGSLRETGRLDPASLAEADPDEVADDWRGAGARSLTKTIRPLQRLARWAVDRFDPDDGRVAGPASTEALRDGLRSLNGVGPATADAILLAGLGRPAYSVDRASYRILVRHGWLDAGADYDEARSIIEGALPDDPGVFALVSSGFERLGREACRAGAPRCERCPLRPLLPDGGPLGDS